jgi:ferredoxin
MWIPGSMAYLVPAFLITMRLIGGSQKRTADTEPRQLRPLTAKKPLDLTGIVRHRHFRRVPQAILFLLAVAVIIDGLFGPQVAPLNLAGVLPWTYWRGFVVIGLLAAGNLFCMACPFMFVRDAVRKLLPPRHRWPVRLRTKWIAAALAALYFMAYEKFGLWNSPWWTAWIAIGYFFVALAIDSWFQGASFCKYVCPIGQFNFVNSLVSPLEVRTRSAAVCDSCNTHDCIRGNEKQRGCEMQLFQPTKAGNFDCTFCMDCVHACPSGNVAVLRALPQQKTPPRRLDIAMLVLVLVFAAFVSAAAMTTGTGKLWMYAAGALVAGAALFPNVGFSLVPLGCSMWAAHFLYHLAIGWNSIAPVLGRLFHITISITHTMSAPGWILNTQLLLLDAGLLWALYLAWRRKSAPAMALAIALYIFGIWVFFQPMEMRGMLML